jgi:membrane protease YdiL (CAAX protease family)
MRRRFKNKKFRNVKYFSFYILVVWAVYRLFFNFPEEAEELFIKPFLWLTPVIYILGKEGKGLKSLGFTKKGLFPALYFSIALGAGFALEGLVLNFFKYGGINFSADIGKTTFFAAFLLSVATAFTEEITFRGYIFNRLWKNSKNELSSNLITSFIWALIHLPITILWWKLGFVEIVFYFILVFIFGVGSAFVFARSKNIGSSILLHVFWEWPIMLFR